MRSILCALALAAGLGRMPKPRASQPRRKPGQSSPLPSQHGRHRRPFRGKNCEARPQLYVVKCARCHKFYNPGRLRRRGVALLDDQG